MVGKLSIVLVLAVFVCCVQANLDRFGDLGTGELGYYKRCFLKWSFANLIGGYYKFPVENSLGEDRDELQQEIDANFSKFGGHKKCSEACYEWLVPQTYSSRPAEDKKLNDSRCERYAKFNRLCELAKAKKSTDFHKFAIEKWLCQTTMDLKEPLYDSFFVCQEDENYPDSYRLAAEQTFETVFSYSPEQLEEAKKKSDAEIEASDKLKKELDDKLTEKVYAMVNKGSERISEYIECSKREKKDKKREKKEDEMRERLEDDYAFRARYRSKSDDSGYHAGEMALLGLASLGVSS